MVIVLFPWDRLTLMHERDKTSVRQTPGDLSYTRGPLMPSVMDHIFRFLGPFDLPIKDMKNPGGLDGTTFVSVRSVLSHVSSTPARHLSFPGWLVSPMTAGDLHREHKATGVPLAQLTREYEMHASKGRRKRKRQPE